jgi:VanZ family protein
MGAGQKSKMTRRDEWVFSTRVQAVLYSFLLVATPFILLQNFLVEMISKVSRSTFAWGGLQLPYVPLIAGVLLAAVLFRYRAWLTRPRLLAGAIVILMNALAQQITDYYFDHNFYDLQQNWHYIAYGIFAVMVYRDLSPRGMPLAKILLLAFVAAFSFSCFDEGFQLRMSNRVFDTSDIAKDGLGCVMGMVMVSLGGIHSTSLMTGARQFLRTRGRSHLRNPFSVLVLETSLAFIMLCCSSLLSDAVYTGWVALLTIGLFLLVCLVVCALPLRRGRLILGGVVLLAILAQGASAWKYRNAQIVSQRSNLTVYNGIPIPFFDLLVFPDGTFRLVDRKHYFNQRDQMFLLKHSFDILVIGSGEKGQGGRGFPEEWIAQFVYNLHARQATEVIILPSAEACQVFNRLKQERKNVLLVLHQGC